MTQKEFEALLAIEGNTYRVWHYEHGMWVAEVNKEGHNYPINFVVGENYMDALNTLISNHYANN